MRKRNFLMLIFGLMLSVSGYSQTSILEHLLFQGAYYQALFPYHDLAFSSYKNTDYLNMIKLGAAWEQPVWKGLGLIGLESGYSSGSKFGGKSDMDFIPIILNMGYNFLLGDFFSVGPNLKLGGFAILTPIGNQIVPMIAGHLEGEFRYRPFPLSLYVAGGVDFFPTVAKGYLPAFEAGLRFRPFALTRAGKEKNEAYSQAGGQSGSQAAGGAALNQDGTATGTGAAALSQGSGAASQGSTAAGLAPVASAQGAG
ncbi:MAG: hypothetical protein LBU82_07980, partial [Treponema sp.]|nr:hypothetical protein [Treponema sp.]